MLLVKKSTDSPVSCALCVAKANRFPKSSKGKLNCSNFTACFCSSTSLTRFLVFSLNSSSKPLSPNLLNACSIPSALAAASIDAFAIFVSPATTALTPIAGNKFLNAFCKPVACFFVSLTLSSTFAMPLRKSSASELTLKITSCIISAMKCV